MTTKEIVNQGIQRGIPTAAERAERLTALVRVVFGDAATAPLVERFAEMKTSRMAILTGDTRCVCGSAMWSMMPTLPDHMAVKDLLVSRSVRQHVQVCRDVAHAAQADLVRAWAATFDHEATDLAWKLVARGCVMAITTRVLARYETELSLYAEWCAGAFESSLEIEVQR